MRGYLSSHPGGVRRGLLKEFEQALSAVFRTLKVPSLASTEFANLGVLQEP